MNPANIRVPDIIANLKVFPGGHRKLKRFDPRIKALWKILVNHVDSETFTIDLNVSTIAEALDVNRGTVRRWLDWMAKHGLLAIKNRRGGRGCGVLVEMTWLKKGEELEARRKQAEEQSKTDHKNPQRNCTNLETDAQRHKAYNTFGDLKNRARLMKQARIALMCSIKNSNVSTQAVVAFGRWLWKEQPSLEQAKLVLDALEVPMRISVPRWAKTQEAVFKWFKGLIKKLIQFGKSWWERLQRKVESRKLENSISSIKQAVDEQKPCPVCKKVHSVWDWEEGRNENGQLNCAGWVRGKLDDLIVARHLEQKEKRRERPQLSVQEQWEEWKEEQEREKISKRKQAKMAQERLKESSESLIFSINET